MAPLPPLTAPTGPLILPLVYAAPIAATTAGVMAIPAPCNLWLHRLDIYARTITGTNPTVDVAVTRGADTLIAAARIEASATAASTDPAAPVAVAAGQLIEVDVAIGGTASPSVTDLTVIITASQG